MTDLVPLGNGEFELQLIPCPGDTFEVGAPGLARGLGFRDATAMLRALPEEEKGYTLVCTPGGDQRISTVTEAGLYRVIGQRQAARIADPKIRDLVERFQRWLFHDALPALRRGDIQIVERKSPAELSPRELAQLVIQEADRADAAEAKVAVLEPRLKEVEAKSVRDAPKVAFVETYVEPTEDLWTFTTVAAQLGMTAVGLYEYLRSRKKIYRTVFSKRWSKSKQRYVIEYQWYAHKAFRAWFKNKDHPEVEDRGYNRQVPTTLYITAVGKARIAEMLATDPPGETKPPKDAA